VSSHEITHLINEFGLVVVFVVVGLQALGLPLPGTTVLIAAAIVAATSHGLPIVGVIAAAAVGVFLGSSAGFVLGRWRGERLLLRVARLLRQRPERVQKLRGEFAVHGGAWLVFGRWLTGVRNVTGLLAGASGMPLNRFIPISACAALLWATVDSLKAYLFGRGLASGDTWLQIVIVVVGLVWMVVPLVLLRRRTARRLRQASTEVESAAG
jgi:membrane protein DedA with SNARE-associated domain